jgi:hypothetical protein
LLKVWYGNSRFRQKEFGNYPCFGAFSIENFRLLARKVDAQGFDLQVRYAVYTFPYIALAIKQG